ncbi:hypothetical protein HA402_014744 [Bradysia odoriphaga]|nr:hypothetical protein HA402_014744 [Bradysia odoriphaga]
MESTKKSSVSSVGILTISDSCSQGLAVDASGPHLIDLVKIQFNPTTVKYDVIPDDMDKIESTLLYYTDVLNLNLILTTGGTGFSYRDVTPEATKKVLEKDAPQLQLAMSLASLEKTKFAVLSRAVSGIRKQSLIINFPGSKKAVSECFAAVCDVLPHAIELIRNDLDQVQSTHRCVQDVQLPARNYEKNQQPKSSARKHVCPHKTGTGNDRNSPYPMVNVDDARRIIKSKLQQFNRNESKKFESFESPFDLPPFRASIKDGYAVKAAGGKGRKSVIGYVAAGDEVISENFSDDCCYKINTGAPVPDFADCVIQVEDTKIVMVESDVEKVIEILVEPAVDLDIRPIGNDLQKGQRLFTHGSPDSVAYPAMFASVGVVHEFYQPKIGIISTGDELIVPGETLRPGKIYDSNSVMLKELLRRFGFTDVRTTIAKDSYEALYECMNEMTNNCDVTICTGGVSMGDKDFVKKVLLDLKMDLAIGRVNMKPGKPMTYASNTSGKHVFGLPGNPLSAFVTFHLFVLPALRYLQGQDDSKLNLSVITVELLNDTVELDPRPEYARASVTSINGKLYAEITGDQISSRLQSICGADVLLHLPAHSAKQSYLSKGAILKASVLKHDFISSYKDH